MKLYQNTGSSCARRVRIAMALKGVDHEAIDVVSGGGDAARASRSAINPMAQVPVLEWVDDGGAVRRLAESVAIIELIEELFPEPPLLPVDRFERARARQLAEIVNASVQPLQNSAVLDRLEAGGMDREAWARWAIERGLRAFDTVLAETVGRYSIGDEVTLADVFLVPQVFNARRYGTSLDGLDRVAAVEAACLELPAFRDTAPPA